MNTNQKLDIILKVLDSHKKRGALTSAKIIELLNDQFPNIDHFELSKNEVVMYLDELVEDEKATVYLNENDSNTHEQVKRYAINLKGKLFIENRAGLFLSTGYEGARQLKNWKVVYTYARIFTIILNVIAVIYIGYLQSLK